MREVSNDGDIARNDGEVRIAWRLCRAGAVEQRVVNYVCLLHSRIRSFIMPDMACKIFTLPRTIDTREETRQIWTPNCGFGRPRECHPPNPGGISYLSICRLQSSLLPYENQSGLPQQVSVNSHETAPSLTQFWPMLYTRVHESLWRSQECIGFYTARTAHRVS